MQLNYATQRTTIGAESDEVRTEQLFGREHVVAPVTLVREMVLKGEFLPFDEIEASQLAWNGKPSTITHPVNDDGQPLPVSTSPDVLEAFSTAILFDIEASSSGRLLGGEVWIDTERSAAVADDLDRDDPAQMLLDGETIEGSVGYWYQRFETEGEFEGESFDSVQVGIQPDHYALLPNSEGECSIEDGCGVGRDDAGAAMSALSSPLSLLYRGAGLLGNSGASNGSSGSHSFGAACTECGGTCGAHDGSGTNHENNTSMTQERITDLAERSAFDVETLEEFSDEQLDALEESLDEQEGGDVSGDDDTDVQIEDIADQVSSRVLDQVDDRLDEFEQQQTADEREQIISEIVVHTGYEVEDLRDWSLDQLETLAEQAVPNGGVYAGRAGARSGQNGTGEDEIPMGVSLDRLEEDD